MNFFSEFYFRKQITLMNLIKKQFSYIIEAIKKAIFTNGAV